MGILLWSYLLRIDISFDKMHFTCNWVDLKCMCLGYQEVY